MSNAALEKLTWMLIYGGLFTGILGLFMALQDDPAGWYTGELLAVTGGVAIFVGIVMVWIRSKRKA